MLATPALRPAFAAPPAGATPAVIATGSAAVDRAGIMPPVAAAGASAAIAAQDEDRARRPPRRDCRAPVLALMRQAEVACRTASRSGCPAQAARSSPASTPDYGFAMAQAQAGLVVRGRLVIATEDGLAVGAGRIYRAGELVAAFSGPHLAFMDGGRLNRLI